VAFPPQRRREVRRRFLSHQSTQPKNKNMNSIIKRIVVLLFLTTLVALVGLGCNTAHGFGKDVEKAGEKIQDGTQ
jgi:predicted small secreted protein